jgi:hypothetical protein
MKFSHRRQFLHLAVGAAALPALAEPGHVTIDDIREFITLSSAREETERKEREDALVRDEARVAEIRTAQDRTAAALAEKEAAQASTSAALAEKEAAQASTAVAQAPAAQPPRPCIFPRPPPDAADLRLRPEIWFLGVRIPGPFALYGGHFDYR